MVQTNADTHLLVNRGLVALHQDMLWCEWNFKGTQDVYLMHSFSKWVQPAVRHKVMPNVQMTGLLRGDGNGGTNVEANPWPKAKEGGFEGVKLTSMSAFNFRVKVFNTLQSSHSWLFHLNIGIESLTFCGWLCCLLGENSSLARF